MNFQTVCMQEIKMSEMLVKQTSHSAQKFKAEQLKPLDQTWRRIWQRGGILRLRHRIRCNLEEKGCKENVTFRFTKAVKVPFTLDNEPAQTENTHNIYCTSEFSKPSWDHSGLLWYYPWPPSSWKNMTNMATLNWAVMFWTYPKR